MKKIFSIAVFATFACVSFGQTTTIQGYQKANGTYVQPYTKTTPNNTNVDNWSTRPNTNPNTGTTGTRAADVTPAATNYGKGQVIQEGPKGGQYYYNSNGNKTYVPKRN